MPWLQRHNVRIDWVDKLFTFDSDHCRNHCLLENGGQKISLYAAPREFDNASRKFPSLPAKTPAVLPGPPIAISAVAFAHVAKRKDHEVFTVSLRDVEKALSDKPVIDPSTVLPKHYHEFLPLFDKSAADKLPPHRPGSDHEINLLPGTQPPAGPLYGMSQNELLVLRKTLEDYLTKGFIRASRSPAASPVLFVKKPGGGLRFCVDYRGLNAVTVKNRYPIPLIQETLERLSKACYFTKLDAVSAFHRIRIAAGDEWKTAFRTRQGLFEWLVVPFGLCNAPASFQTYINDSLGRDILDQYVTAYIDDVLIYSNSLEEHRAHVRTVLQRLLAAGLQIDINKCEFEVQSTKYLGMIISGCSTDGSVPGSIQMDPAKIEAMTAWERPQSPRDILAFLGFANFYRRFIQGFSKLSAPLSNLCKKDNQWHWGEGEEKAFQALKQAFTTAPVLQHFDSEKPITVETDASDYASGGVLLQPDNSNVLRPVAYFSKKHNPAECNYEIYDKELMAIVRAFEQWRPELEGAKHAVSVVSDHKNLEYFMSSKKLSRRQARWSEFLSRFDFTIKYRPEKLCRADGLTRRGQDLPRDVADDRMQWQQQTVLKKKNLDPQILAEALPVRPVRILRRDQPLPFLGDLPPAGDQDEPLNDPDQPTTDLPSAIDEAYQTMDRSDPVSVVRKQLINGERLSELVSLVDCSVANNKVYFQKRLWIPEGDIRSRCIKEAHDSPLHGHPGRNKTLEMLQRTYYWPKMQDSIQAWIKDCVVCCRAKPSRETWSSSSIAASLQTLD